MGSYGILYTLVLCLRQLLALKFTLFQFEEQITKKLKSIRFLSSEMEKICTTLCFAISYAISL